VASVLCEAGTVEVVELYLWREAKEGAGRAAAMAAG
jgi:hypothetical protein